MLIHPLARWSECLQLYEKSEKFHQSHMTNSDEGIPLFRLVMVNTRELIPNPRDCLNNLAQSSPYFTRKSKISSAST